MSSAKLDQIGEQQAQKKAEEGGNCAFDDQRNARGPLPGGVTYAWNLLEQPLGLRLLKIIRRPGKDELTRQGPAMDFHVDAFGGLVGSEHFASDPFDLRRETVSGAESPMPQGRGYDRERCAGNKERDAALARLSDEVRLTRAVL